MNAFLTGLEQAREAGKDLSKIHSVASFFVSRVDTEIDKRLDAIGTDEAKALKGKAAVANARLAYQAFEEVFATPRWKNLADDGANAQRPLWASTGVKDPAYSDTLYVTELVAPQHRQHDAREDAGGRRRPRRGHRRHHRRHLRRGRRCARRARGPRHLLRRRHRAARARGRRQVRGRAGASCSTRRSHDLDLARADVAEAGDK